MIAAAAAAAAAADDDDYDTGDSELVLKFSAGLAVSVNFIATIDNVQHVDRLRIQVTIRCYIYGIYIVISVRTNLPAYHHITLSDYNRIR